MSDGLVHLEGDERRERLLRLALWMVRGISARAIGAAIEAHGSLERACGLQREELARAMGLKPGGLGQLCRAPEDLEAWARGELELVARRGGRVLLRGDGDYPDLGALADPPEGLFCRGALGSAGRLGAEGAPEAVAIVGARRADPDAIRQARSMAAALVAEGFTVVSGGAIGVDAAAHEGALGGDGATVAVLGSGVLRPLPAGNRRLFSRILLGGGGLASELPPLAGGRAEHFPRRNRLIAALSRAVVVVRAAAGSGSLHTARAMEALGRPVFVVPAPELGAASAGGEALLEKGAVPVRSPEELLAALRGVEPPALPCPDSIEERILAAIGAVPASVGEVAARIGSAQGDVVTVLSALCVRGLARPAGPGRFVRC